MTKKVLLVDDDKSTREVIGDFLEAWGFEVIPAANGEEAWALFLSAEPDLLLVDVLLPLLNGFQLCERIRKSPSHSDVPIILISALYKTAKIQKDSKEKYGLADYLVKPISLKETASKLAKILGTSKEELLAARNAETTERLKTASVSVPERVRERPEAIADAPDSGEIAAGTSALVLLSLYRGRRTGIATFTNAEATKKIYLRKGDAIYATSTLPEENFGYLLTEDGLLTAEQAAAALRLAKEKGALFGKVLTDEGLIDGAMLAKYLIKEVHVRVHELLSWKSGSYQFTDDQSFVEKVKRPPIRLLNDLYWVGAEGILDDVYRSRYEKYPDAVVLKSEERLSVVSEVEWEPDDLLLIALIDGARTPAEILEESGWSREKFWRVLGLLEHAGVVRLE